MKFNLNSLLLQFTSILFLSFYIEIKKSMRNGNRLINEKSPYLLQHAHNPVDWYPWCEEAFEKAKTEDKPVFLSIGYSTCHWCHVMENESFEDEEVARLMNDAFISIKVDREERPDIDGIYMTICQMLTGSGGWPLTIIMTPDKKPFLAGTYFPKESRFGRTGLLELIPQIKNFWTSNREEINKSAGDILSTLEDSNKMKAGLTLGEKFLDKVFEKYLNRFDHQFGGFNEAPKFPSPHNLLFLLRYWKRSKDKRALVMVEKTLTQMRLGGIYDQVGFGFHRYSTDRQWLVPHFEKMLYDQALLVSAYTEAYQAAKNIFYKDTAEEIIKYVLRDMTSPEGGFYSAEDADSEGEEGKFYLWRKDEIKSILGDEADLFIKIFNITDDGNYVDHALGGKTGASILHLNKRISEAAEEFNLKSDELTLLMNSAREKLFNIRDKRIHPFKDDKILTDWNALMISALAKSSLVFNQLEYLAAAEKSMDFILSKMIDANGLLLHRYRQGEASFPGNIDDYAFVIAALIDLYEASFKTKYLKDAVRLNSELIKHFWDEKEGGFFFTGNFSEQLLIRRKEIYDGAVPSGNSAELLNLIRLGRITSNSDYENKASAAAKLISNSIQVSPLAFAYSLCALDFAFGPSNEIVISCGNTEEARDYVKLMSEFYIPNKVVIINSERDEHIRTIAPFTANQFQLGNKATAYVCRNYICNLPVNKPKDFAKLLENICR